MNRYKVKEKIALINFHFEFGTRIINNFRSLMMVVIVAKLFEVPLYFYPFIIFSYGSACWFLGYISDKFNLPPLFQSVYYTKSGNQVLIMQQILQGIRSGYNDREYPIIETDNNSTTSISNNNRGIHKGN
jgi:hypothetical protein